MYYSLFHSFQKQETQSSLSFVVVFIVSFMIVEGIRAVTLRYKLIDANMVCGDLNKLMAWIIYFKKEIPKLKCRHDVLGTYR